MKERHCKHCHRPIPPEKKGGTEFCNNTCRSRYWRERNTGNTSGKTISTNLKPEQPQAPQKTEPPLSSSLRGVIDSDEKTPDPLPASEPPVPESTPAPDEDRATLLVRKRDDLESISKNLSEKIKQIERDIEILAGKNLKGVISPFLMLPEAERNKRRTQLEFKLFSLRQQKEENFSEWAKINLEILYPDKKKNETIALKDVESETSPPAEKSADPAPVEKNPATLSSKVISSKDLMEKSYPCLNFSDKWFDFIGKPAVVFHAVIHGKPGEGKSTFCFQWAHYLAENFGRVVYISAEEGFSKTLRDKLVNNNAESGSLFFNDSKSFDEMKKKIGRNDFHFIIIDSLDTLRIDAEKLKQLREHYPASAFITISQSTKDGKMRGSQEIIHDSDIEIAVQDGVATTKKNRFREKGMTYRVFTEPPSDKKPMEPPRNVVK